MAPSEPDELNTSLVRLLGTSAESAEKVWSEFFPRLIRLAQKKLVDLPKRAYDEEDVALSALNSFFRGRSDGKFSQVTSKDELWRLLATITIRKATAQRRRDKAAKRGGGAIRGESVFFRPGESQASAGLAAFRDDNAIPETAEEILAACAEMLERLPDEKLRTTAVLRLEGYSNIEIAEKLGCSTARTKQRLQRIREIWKSIDA